MLVPRFLPLVIQLERKTTSSGRIELDDPDLDDETRRKFQGPAERGRFRVARLFGLKSARQVRSIETGASTNAPHLWGREPPFGEPFPEIAQYFGTLYFFEEVLGWPFSEALGRLTHVVTTAKRILAQGRARPTRRDPQRSPG